MLRAAAAKRAAHLRPLLRREAAQVVAHGPVCEQALVLLLEPRDDVRRDPAARRTVHRPRHREALALSLLLQAAVALKFSRVGAQKSVPTFLSARWAWTRPTLRGPLPRRPPHSRRGGARGIPWECRRPCAMSGPAEDADPLDTMLTVFCALEEAHVEALVRILGRARLSISPCPPRFDRRHRGGTRVFGCSPAVRSSYPTALRYTHSHHRLIADCTRRRRGCAGAG